MCLYSRYAHNQASVYLKKWADAIDFAEEGLKRDAANADLTQLRAAAQAALAKQEGASVYLCVVCVYIFACA